MKGFAILRQNGVGLGSLVLIKVLFNLVWLLATTAEDYHKHGELNASGLEPLGL